MRALRWTSGTGVAVVCAMWLLAATPASAQRGAAPAGPPGAELGQNEVQRLFDAYMAMQAQEALGLDDDQFSRFLPRLRELHQLHRRLEGERMRTTMELARMLAPGRTPDEARLRDQMKRLADLEARTYAELRAAHDAIDQVLDVPRQARFRVFELQMERRKLDLLLRARRAQPGRQGLEGPRRDAPQ
jgi:hypothetical protein